ncbi:hypothetical protein [Streptomyces violascens]|uniref:Uncharacterized protein n=1 Tax=Streptomyces violascens TaxID=67381 RepID=A0ABQ3QQQ3_9ACTN|nr:hypothetical protein [Streptomyces violascens]GGU48975.1 hypothetical protein GCM10010289_81870 [Streptomyces violascens]GHI39613.1 hypothetical protein Sviol_40210 [Streptomyces violascens]
MEREYKIRDTEFTRWLLDQARSAGWDVDSDHDARQTIRLTAALIRTGNIGDVDAPRLANALGVTVADIERAAAKELAENEAAAQVLDRPDMMELDEHLDSVAWPDDGKKGPERP